MVTLSRVKVVFFAFALLSGLIVHPTGLFNGVSSAQTSALTYRACIVTVTSRKGDPMMPNGLAALPQHHYVSELYQGPERSQEFLTWVIKSYKKEWVYNGVAQNYGEQVRCIVAMRPQLFGADMNRIKNDPNQAPYYTYTARPSVQ